MDGYQRGVRATDVAPVFAAYEAFLQKALPEIRAKAAELTKGKSYDLDKIQALYDYVATNFRYISLSFGVGRYQPHSAADVLHNQYGDCKDKHTLLASLLVAASPATIQLEAYRRDDCGRHQGGRPLPLANLGRPSVRY